MDWSHCPPPQHWIANNLFGLAFSLNGVELLHLNNVSTGCILLGGLFIYDVFWVSLHLLPFSGPGRSHQAEGCSCGLEVRAPEKVPRGPSWPHPQNGGERRSPTGQEPTLCPMPSATFLSQGGPGRGG